jgi:hypothetical protein
MMPMFLTNTSHSNKSQSEPCDESPFSSNSSFVMYLEPIYNSFLQTYQNVITFNCNPSGPLSKMVTQINFPKLSPFKQSGPNFHGSPCVFTLLRYPVCKIGSGNSALKYNGALMGSDDIPSVFSYLQTHGYTIDTSTTTMLHNGPVNIGGVSDHRFSGNRRMIAMVSFI